MITYISLAVREYGEGRICISTDRMGGDLTSHGTNEKAMWRKVLEWTGKSFPSENINVGVIESYSVESLTYINDLVPASYEKIDLQFISQSDLTELEKFDLLYFIGLPDLVATEALENIKSYVKNGGGILVENPNRGGEYINVLSGIDNIFCSSMNRPLFSSAYWTVSGESHYIYESKAKTYFYTTLELDAFSSDWNLLMTSAEVIKPKTPVPPSDNFSYSNSSSEIGIGYTCGFKNGIVVLEES